MESDPLVTLISEHRKLWAIPSPAQALDRPRSDHSISIHNAPIEHQVVNGISCARSARYGRWLVRGRIAEGQIGCLPGEEVLGGSGNRRALICAWAATRAFRTYLR